MSTYVIRIWLPDRPGALGAVASRIGAVRGDVIGIDIIENGGGRAIDELTVFLDNDSLIDLLISEIREVDEVDIEHVRALDSSPVDPVLTSLEIAHHLMHHSGSPAAFGDTVRAIEQLFRATWVALIDTETSVVGNATQVLACSGSGAPTGEWLVAFTQGATMRDEPVSLGDIAVSTILGSPYAVVVGRDQLPLRGREQEQLDALGALLGHALSASATTATVSPSLGCVQLPDSSRHTSHRLPVDHPLG